MPGSDTFASGTTFQYSWEVLSSPLGSNSSNILTTIGLAATVAPPLQIDGTKESTEIIATRTNGAGIDSLPFLGDGQQRQVCWMGAARLGKRLYKPSKSNGHRHVRHLYRAEYMPTLACRNDGWSVGISWSRPRHVLGPVDPLMRLMVPTGSEINRLMHLPCAQWLVRAAEGVFFKPRSRIGEAPA